MTCYFYTYLFKTRTRFLAWVGNDSFEFYIFHYIFLKLFSKVYDVNKYFYAAGVLFCTIILVYIYLAIKNYKKKVQINDSIIR